MCVYSALDRNHWDKNIRKALNNHKELRKIAKETDKSYTIPRWQHYVDHFTERMVSVIKTSKSNKSNIETTKQSLLAAIEHLASSGKSEFILRQEKRFLYNFQYLLVVCEVDFFCRICCDPF